MMVSKTSYHCRRNTSVKYMNITLKKIDTPKKMHTRLGVMMVYKKFKCWCDFTSFLYQPKNKLHNIDKLFKLTTKTGITRLIFTGYTSWRKIVANENIVHPTVSS